MPPHCDSLDGPVVTAAREALTSHEVERVLPFVPAEGEPEVRAAFDLTIKARTQGPEAQEVADRYFFETVVRVHRAGEGAPFTGLKPAGLDVGPVIPLAEAAVERGDPSALADFLADEARAEVRRRFDEMTLAQADARTGVPEARRYVEAMLDLEVWAHHLFEAVHSGAHGEHGHRA